MLEVKRSKIHGKGVFASRDFRKDERIFKFAPKLYELAHEAGCHCAICCRSIQIQDSYWLYPDKGSHGWHINHSCEPNAGIIGYYIVALRDIPAGEEITVDFSTTRADPVWRMDCQCAMPTCRKEIRSVHHMPEHLFERLFNYMPDWVRRQRRPTTKAPVEGA